MTVRKQFLTTWSRSSRALLCYFIGFAGGGKTEKVVVTVRKLPSSVSSFSNKRDTGVLGQQVPQPNSKESVASASPTFLFESLTFGTIVRLPACNLIGTLSDSRRLNRGNN